MTNDDLVEGVIPKHETSILAGASGAGKTTLLMAVIRCLQENKPVFGHPATPNLKIGYIAADRTWRAYTRLADTTGVDLSRIKVRALIDDPDLDLKSFEFDPQITLYSLLYEMAQAGCNLVIVDPLVVFLGCATNVYHTNAARLIRLNRFCTQNGITILGTHHATKARTDYGFKRPQDRISGTSALLGFTSTQLFLAAADETEKGEYTEWHIVSHHAKAKVIYLKRNNNGLFEEVPQAPEPVDISMFNLDIAAEIVNLLPASGTPVARKAIVARLAPASARAVDYKLQELVVQKVIQQYENGFYGVKL